MILLFLTYKILCFITCPSMCLQFLLILILGLASSNSVAFFVRRLTNWSNTLLPVFLGHVAKGNRAGVEEVLGKYGTLLLEKGQIETYARDFMIIQLSSKEQLYKSL